MGLKLMNWLKDVLLTPLHIGQVACQAEKIYLSWTTERGLF